MDLSVVVPLYNEIENIPMLMRELHETLSRVDMTYQVIIVDDGSSDGSWEKLVECSGQYPHFRLIRFRRNFGQTAAMNAGFRESKGKIVVTLDADLQNDPADIPLLIKKAHEGFDVVSGWRKNRKDRFLSRTLPSRIANAVISRMTGVHLHDYGCTLKAYGREIVSKLHLYGEMHRFIPALAYWIGGNVTEVEVNHRPRRFGKSKYGIARTSRVILDLITVRFLMRYSTRPIQIFGKIGLMLGIPGILLLFTMLLGHIFYNLCALTGSEPSALLVAIVTIAKRPSWIITGFMLTLFSTQFISMGLLAEIQIRTYHESQGRQTYTIREIVEPVS